MPKFDHGHVSNMKKQLKKISAGKIFKAISITRKVLQHLISKYCQQIASATTGGICDHIWDILPNDHLMSFIAG